MKLPRPYSLAELAELLGCKYAGDPNHLTTGINEIHMVEAGDLVFVDHPKYYSKALECAATTVLINQEVPVPEGKGLLISDDPFRDFNAITKRFNPFIPTAATISATAKIGHGTIIQPGAFVGNNVVIGNDCVIHPNVSILDNSVLGNNVVVQANSVIGSDAFYYKRRPEGYDRLLSGGRTVLEDRVEIGASCTIDRGVSGDTRIGAGSKLDNQVHIGHDTQLGQDCLLAAQVAIAGCTTLGNGVTCWGQVGITSGIHIGDKAVILAQSGVSKSLEGGKTYFGYPAEEARKAHRIAASLRSLPDLLKKLGH